MEPYALQASDAERGESVVVLQASKLALDGYAASVEVAPLPRTTGELDAKGLFALGNGVVNGSSMRDDERGSCWTPSPLIRAAPSDSSSPLTRGAAVADSRPSSSTSTVSVSSRQRRASSCAVSGRSIISGRVGRQRRESVRRGGAVAVRGADRASPPACASRLVASRATRTRSKRAGARPRENTHPSRPRRSRQRRRPGADRILSTYRGAQLVPAAWPELPVVELLRHLRRFIGRVEVSKASQRGRSAAVADRVQVHWVA